MGRPAAAEAVLSRIRTRAILLGVLASAAAFLFGWRAGVSLTICAAVVIFSFLVFERLTERLVRPSAKRGFSTAVPLLLVTAAGLVVLAFVFLWKAFDPVAGLVGLSIMVLAIGAEIFQRPGEE